MYGLLSSTNRRTQRVESADGIRSSPPLRMFGFLGIRVIEASRFGLLDMSGGGVDGTPFDGGSTLEVLRMLDIGSWHSFQNLRYFSSSPLSWSDIAASSTIASSSVVGPSPLLTGGVGGRLAGEAGNFIWLNSG